MREVEAGGESLEGAVIGAVVRAVGEDELELELEGGAKAALSPTEVRDRETGGLRVKAGDALSVLVEQWADGRWLVSRDKAERLAALDRVAACFDRGEPVEGMVVGEQDGGFSVDVGVKAFLPASQVGLRPVRRPDDILGETFSFRVLRFDRERVNVVLSRRVLLEEERERTLARLVPDAVIEGTVRSLVDYGAFVDVGGMDGLLHVSDLSWGRVRHPSEVVKVGQRLTVKVLKFDREANRLSLGLRQLEDDPWVGAAGKYAPGTRVTGMVVSKTDFGVFVSLEPGLEGLVHAAGAMGADAARERLRRAGIGEDLAAEVVEVDVPRKRISLVLAGDASA
jgi:small subunit ribosomal protein S1